MSHPDLEDLPLDLQALLADERGRNDLPRDARAELFSKICAALPPGSVPLGEVPDSGDPAPPGPAGPKPLAAPPGAAASGHALVRAARWILPLTFGAGALTGGATYATYRRLTDPVSAPPATVSLVAPPPSVPAATSVVAAPSSPPSVESSVAAAPPASAAVKTAVNASPSASAQERPGSGSDQDDALFAERASLEIARTAVGRGQSAAALTALDRHAREFPRGRLGEERDSLQIQALLLAGRVDAARSRAETFRRRYPRSLFLRVLDASFPPTPPPEPSQ